MEETHSGATLVIEYKDMVGVEMEELLEKDEEVEQRLPTTEKNVEEPTTREDDVMDIVRQITTEVEPNSTAKVPEETHFESNQVETAEKDELQEEGEQLLLTTEEVTANLAARNSDAGRVDVEVEEDRNANLDPTERVETEGVETTVDVPERREIVIVTDEEEVTEGVPPAAEIVQSEAAAVLTYQRRPARDEASEQRLEGGHLRNTPRQRKKGNVESPARSPVRAHTRRRRLLIDEESEDEDDVFFTPMDAQPSQRQPDAPAEVDDNEREKKEWKRKGKTIAAPVKKKPRQPSTTLVIQEGRQRITNE